MTDNELIELATELKNYVCNVFAPGKHTEMDVVHMPPGLRSKIIAALRQTTVPLLNHCRICGKPRNPDIMVICVDCSDAMELLERYKEGDEEILTLQT